MFLHSHFNTLNRLVGSFYDNKVSEIAPWKRSLRIRRIRVYRTFSLTLPQAKEYTNKCDTLCSFDCESVIMLPIITNFLKVNPRNVIFNPPFAI